MPMTLGTFIDYNPSDKIDYLGSDYSDTAGTSFTFSGKDLGRTDGLFVLLVTLSDYASYPSITAGGTELTGYRVPAFNTAATSSLICYGRPSVSSGDIVVETSVSVSNIVISWFRIGEGTTNYRDGDGTASVSSSLSATALSTSSANGGSYVLGVSSHENTNNTNVTSSNMGLTNVVNRVIDLVPSRRHTVTTGRATVSTTNGVLTHSWSNSAVASLIVLTFNP